MSKFPFPWLALGLGLLLSLMLLDSAGDETPRLPLLTQLIVTEFGFILSAVGAGLGARDLLRGGLRFGLLVAAAGCALLALALALHGLRLWAGLTPA